MPKLNKQSILYERMKRQRFLDPISSSLDEEEYIKLFRLLQPVAPVHFTMPGSPPKLMHRTAFNDDNLSNRLRQKHQLIKGRFAGGRVGYVLQENLEQYANAFRKYMIRMKPIHEDILSKIKHSGGISKDQLKDELDYPNGEITRALNNLQEAFLVYEDQTDNDWDTGWFDFETEWFELPNDEDKHIEHIAQVLLNYLNVMVFASLSQIKDWSELNIRKLKKALESLQKDGEIQLVQVDGLGEGYIRTIDFPGFQRQEELHHVFMLDKSDILVRSHLSELKERYKGLEVLQYLFIDGEFKGAVLGHWRIGPYDIDDIVVELDPQAAEARKEEIIEAVRKIYSPERTAILKYNGENLERGE